MEEDSADEPRRLSPWQKFQLYVVYVIRSRKVPLICFPILIPIYLILSPFVLIYYCVGYIIGRRHSTRVASEDDPDFVEYVSGLGNDWRMINDGASVAEASVVQDPSYEASGVNFVQEGIYEEAQLSAAPLQELGEADTNIGAIVVPCATEVGDRFTSSSSSHTVAQDELTTIDIT